MNDRRNRMDDVTQIVFRGLTSIVEGQSSGEWMGTMSNLNSALNRVLSQKQRTLLPASPSALRVVVNRVVNKLRNRGIGVKFGRTNSTRFVKFVK